MSKVRINDLARELEVKSREILDTLAAVGVTEKQDPLEFSSREMTRPNVCARILQERGSPVASFETRSRRVLSRR